MAQKVTTALVRNIPSSFVNAIAKTPSKVPIDVNIARAEHKVYIDAFKKLNVEVIEIPADEHFPDCIFIEDTCVVIGDTALMANSGAPSRRGETPCIESKLKELGITNICHTSDNDETATMDGGDILVTPWHIFAGQSLRTNLGGVTALRSTFKHLVSSVHAIPVGDSLHLKCICTWAGENRLILTENDEGDAVRKMIESSLRATDPSYASKYEFIPVPNESEANVVYLNGTLLVPSERLHTQEVLKNRGLPFIPVPNGEISKADGSTTCCSVLLSIS